MTASLTTTPKAIQRTRTLQRHLIVLVTGAYLVAQGYCSCQVVGRKLSPSPGRSERLQLGSQGDKLPQFSPYTQKLKVTLRSRLGPASRLTASNLSSLMSRPGITLSSTQTQRLVKALPIRYASANILATDSHPSTC